MRLFEAIIDANHRAAAGDQHAGLHLAEFESALPLVALTCIDVRLNALLPEVLGIPKDQFIWLRNAGNIITSSLSSTMRSLALACVVKGGKEVAIIGHTNCQVGKTSAMDLIDRFRALGVERQLLPANVNEFFGMFASERANVIKAVDLARQSPLIGLKVPVHGLLLDIETGRVEWLVNGYQSLDTLRARQGDAATSTEPTLDALKSLADGEIGGIKQPQTRIGDTVSKSEDWLSGSVHQPQDKPAPAPVKPSVKSAAPPRIPLPPPLRPKMRFHK